MLPLQSKSFQSTYGQQRNSQKLQIKEIKQKQKVLKCERVVSAMNVTSGQYAPMCRDELKLRRDVHRQAAAGAGGLGGKTKSIATTLREKIGHESFQQLKSFLTENQVIANVSINIRQIISVVYLAFQYVIADGALQDDGLLLNTLPFPPALIGGFRIALCLLILLNVVLAYLAYRDFQIRKIPRWTQPTIRVLLTGPVGFLVAMVMDLQNFTDLQGYI